MTPDELEVLSRMAHALDASAIVLDRLPFTHLDHAAIGDRM